MSSKQALLDQLALAGLRMTRPRRVMVDVLFGDGIDRHVTAESLAADLARGGEPVALATVYNTLHSFVEAGVMREVRGVGDGAAVFDTNIHPHHHIYDETAGTLSDISADALKIMGVPDVAGDKQIVGVDVVVRVR